MKNFDDTELLRRIASRDRSAAAEFFNRYAAEVFAYLRRRLGPDEAEELLQEVFVRALCRASSFREESSVRTWLHAITRHTLYERYRRRFEGETLGSLAVPGPGPESLAISSEERDRLIAALEQLPDDQAIVLELHRVDGLSHGEIARSLGISVAASRKRLQRALATLARNLGSRADRKARHPRMEYWRNSLLRRMNLEESP